MSEDGLPTAGLPAQPKRRKVGFKLKMALLEVIERKQINYMIDYKAIAARHQTTNSTLRGYYRDWKRGLIDLGEPITAEEKQIDARVMHERTIHLLKRHQAILIRYYEGALFATEDAASKKERDAFEKYGLPKLLTQLSRVMELKAKAEHGYNTILEDGMMLRAAGEKPVLPAKVTDIQATSIVTANDEERALKALEDHAN